MKLSEVIVDILIKRNNGDRLSQNEIQLLDEYYKNLEKLPDISDYISEEQNILLREYIFENKLNQKLQKHNGKLNFVFKRWMAAAVALLFCIVLYTTYLHRSKNVQKEYISSSNISKKYIELPDHSRIWLGKNSVVKLLENFNDKYRMLTLEGTAFFEVSHDNGKPFIVKAGNIEVEVKGTSFEVTSNKLKNYNNVIVQSGRVAVKSSSKEYILKSHEAIKIDHNQVTFTSINDKDSSQHIQFHDIRNISLDFRGERLEHVMNMLELQYKFYVTYPDSLKDELIYANLESMNIQEAVHAIATILDIRYTIDSIKSSIKFYK
ncbi:MAG: FecR family protein [Arachidicoccus sp.]|nr:FecR family protein [Arachidicoccus sp.]